MNYVILIQSGYKISCSDRKLQKAIELLKEDPKVLTVDYVTVKEKK